MVPSPRPAEFFCALPIIALVVIVLLMIGLPFATGRADNAISPQPPSQPAMGPGGVEAVFTKVLVTVHDDERPGYWLFEPDAARDRAMISHPLPLVLFLSGCCPPPDTLNPEPAKYRDWIDHIVKRGAVVIYPRFRFYSGLHDVMEMVRAAVAEITSGSHPAVDTAISRSPDIRSARCWQSTTPPLLPTSFPLPMPSCWPCPPASVAPIRSMT